LIFVLLKLQKGYGGKILIPEIQGGKYLESILCGGSSGIRWIRRERLVKTKRLRSAQPFITKPSISIVANWT
jgi:hypothetical protein